MGIEIKNICVKGNRVSAEVWVSGEKNDVWYEFPWDMEKISVRPANAFLVAFMSIAMKVGGTYKIDGEISQNLYNQMVTYQDIMTKWYPELSRVEIFAEKVSEDIVPAENKKKISCFTGGVDAFYSLIKNSEKIDNLLYVWGFDIPLNEENFYNEVQQHLSSAAADFGKEIVLVKTNLGFEVTNKYASWLHYCYGGAIASVVLLMSQQYELCFMPSCNDYSVLEPQGSHVLINHLWGCDGLRFVYDGAEASRVEKVNYIADNQVVQKHLRVCWRSKDAYNCSECEKCIRTMVSLEAVNKLDKVTTFCKPLVVEDISKIKLGNEAQLRMAEASLNTAIENNKDEIANQLRVQIADYKDVELVENLRGRLDTLMNDAAFADIGGRVVDWYVENDTKRTGKKVFKMALKKMKNKFKGFFK